MVLTSIVQRAVIQVDGSFCEGGGQLLRNAVTLSALLSKPISVSNVRQNRHPPGLRKQHEAGINFAAAICSAETKGVEVDSTVVEFRPGPIRPASKMLAVDPGTAGSTTLLLQVALPCLLFSPPESPARSESQSRFSDPSYETPSVLTLYGGTNASFAPQIDYTQIVLLPFLSKHFGISPALAVRRRGYYPRGGGTVLCILPPVHGPLPPAVLTDRGEVRAIRGYARVGGLPLQIAQRMASGARRALLDGGITPEKIFIVSVRERDEEVVGAGGGIMLWAETDHGCRIGGSAVSTREKKPEAVGKEAAKELARNLDHGGCVDEYLQDQMIIFLALARGTSIVKAGPLTDHTRTAIHIAQLMTGAKFHVDENRTDGTIITCEGIGFVVSPPAK